MFVKWYEVECYNGVKKVQGLGEKFVAETLNSLDIKWDRPKPIKTPFGNYTPDFWLEDFKIFLEVKGMRTAMKMVGILSLLENGKTEWSGKIDEISLNKMKWTSENVYPIDIYINDNPNDEKYYQFLETFKEKITGFKFIYKKEAFVSYLKIK